jgi:hypothetical protein
MNRAERRRMLSGSNKREPRLREAMAALATLQADVFNTSGRLGPFALPSVLAETLAPLHPTLDVYRATGPGFEVAFYAGGATLDELLMFGKSPDRRPEFALVRLADGTTQRFDDPAAWARWCVDEGLMSVQELAAARRKPSPLQLHEGALIDLGGDGEGPVPPSRG